MSRSPATLHRSNRNPHGIDQRLYGEIATQLSGLNRDKWHVVVTGNSSLNPFVPTDPQCLQRDLTTAYLLHNGHRRKNMTACTSTRDQQA
jgi:hypothetical protein